jgi:hypothetical protein
MPELVQQLKEVERTPSAQWNFNNRERAKEIRRKSDRKRRGVKVKFEKKRRTLDLRLELLYAARRRAKAEGLTFDLTIDDIVVPEVCPVLGISLFKGTRKNRDHSPSVDRFLPVLGYTRRNIRVISWRANDLKKNATVEELTKVLSYMKGEHA